MGSGAEPVLIVNLSVSVRYTTCNDIAHNGVLHMKLDNKWLSCFLILAGCSSSTAPPVDAAANLPDGGGTADSGGPDVVTTFDAATEPAAVTFTDTVSMFHLNVQEYGYLSDSADLVKKVMDLFDSLDMRLDIYLTTWMIDEYEAKYPDLLKRILTTPNVSVSYHTRPPKPYRASFNDKDGHDWYGLWNMDAQKQYDEIKLFESFGVDLTTGQRTTAEGGFTKLKRLYGRAPYVAGDEADGQQMQSAVDKVFKDLGTAFVIGHGHEAFEGDTRNGVPLKPEVVDAKVFSFDSSLDGDACVTNANGKDVYDCEMARCSTATKKPCTVAYKMHDNDFLADDSWWLTVYGKKTPPWNPAARSPQLTAEGKAKMWNRYEQIVRRAKESLTTYGNVGAKDWAKRLK